MKKIQEAYKNFSVPNKHKDYKGNVVYLTYYLIDLDKKKIIDKQLQRVDTINYTNKQLASKHQKWMRWSNAASYTNAKTMETALPLIRRGMKEAKEIPPANKPYQGWSNFSTWNAYVWLNHLLKLTGREKLQKQIKNPEDLKKIFIRNFKHHTGIVFEHINFQELFTKMIEGDAIKEGLFGPSGDYANVKKYWDEVASKLNAKVKEFIFSAAHKSRKITLVGKDFLATIFQSWRDQGTDKKPITKIHLFKPMDKEIKLGAYNVWPNAEDYADDLEDYLMPTYNESKMKKSELLKLIKEEYRKLSEDWFSDMSEDDQAQYLHDHPNSAKAKEVKSSLYHGGHEGTIQKKIKSGKATASDLLNYHSKGIKTTKDMKQLSVSDSKKLLNLYNMAGEDVKEKFDKMNPAQLKGFLDRVKKQISERVK